MENTPKIGAHVSVAGGVYNAIENALSIGAYTMQIFGSSPQQWQVRKPLDADIQKYKELQKQHGIKPVFLHAPYLVNLASTKKEIREKSKKALIGHMEIAHSLKAEGVIFHVNSPGLGGAKEEALKRVRDGVEYVLKNTPDNTNLILENGAGAGGQVGVSAEELAFIIKEAASQRVKVCLDTAHAFAAGVMDFDASTLNKTFSEWEDIIGKGRITVLHLNDSKVPAGSKKDRHENIGEGYIGLQGFKNLASIDSARKLPWILEVPGFAKEGPDRKNIKIVKSLL